jgi:hypothetical protein
MSMTQLPKETANRWNRRKLIEFTDTEQVHEEHVINIRESLSEMRDIVGEDFTVKQAKFKAWIQNVEVNKN